MVAINDTISHAQVTLERIQMMIQSDQRLKEYHDSLYISFEDGAIILRGQLPSDELRGELIPAIRRAGILNRVCNEVHVC